MNRHIINLAGAGLIALASLGATTLSITPAAAVGPVLYGLPSAPSCVPGFATITSLNWLLKCRKIVSVAQKGVALTQAYNADCTPTRYWNFGPSVTAATAGNLVTVEYICGHVEG